MREAFDASGPLASVDALAAICGIGRRMESGTLHVTGPAGESARFGFAGGALVALDPPADSGPADVLIRGGKVQRATYEALTVGDFEDRFAVAAASGVISRREANWGLKISAIESLVRVLSWTDGEYAWEEGDPEPTAPALKLRIDQWVLELFLRSNDRGFVVRKIGPADVPVARAEGFAESFAALGLTADADAVVEGVDGRRTVDEIVKRSRADEFATLKLLAALITLGLVLPIHEIPEAAEDDSFPTPGPEAAPTTEEPAAAEPEEFELATGSPIAPEPEPVPEPESEPEDLPAEEEPEAFPVDERPLAPPSAEELPPERPWELDAIESDVDSERADAGEVPVSEAEESIPALPPMPIPIPEISVPLFALTAPEPEATSAPEPAPEEPPPAGDGGPHRRLGGLRGAAVLAALALAGILIVSRRRPAPPANEPAPPPAATRSGGPASSTAAKEGPPATAPPVPEPAPKKSPERVVPKPAPRSTPKKSTAAEEHPKKAAPAEAAEKSDSWDALARAGRRTFDHPGAHRYAIQLELACEESTLHKAFAADPGRRQIWLAPFSYRGRSCYRVLWGKYRDLDSAKAAKSSVPEMFSRDGNHPTVVPLGRAK
jgi:hypothetical protein